MSDLVSSAIAGRSRDDESLRKSLVISAMAHGVGLVLLVVAPTFLGLQRRAPDTVMTISLGGVAGPVTGGMTPLSGRAVQRAEPKPELPKPEPVRPPASKPPDMVEPSKATRQAPRPPVATAPKEASSRTPTTGPEVLKGAGIDPKGAHTNEAGLSTGGGGDNSQVTLGNFCDPQYLGQMISLIHRNWNPRQSVVGMPIVRYIIQRDGALTDVSLKQSSGFAVLDLNATRAVQLTRAIPPLPSCYPNPTFIVNLTFEYSVITVDRRLVILLAAFMATPLLLAQQPPASQPPTQPTEGGFVIRDTVGGRPRLAVPDFVALTPDAETKAIAATIGSVLWNDFDFEQEFYMVPRDTYATIPPATSIDAVPFDRWKELGAEGVVIGTVRKSATGITVQARLFSLADQKAAFAKEYSGSGANPRIYAHTIADEIHKQQRSLDGVARTKLTFSSDRDGERLRGTIEIRGIKEIYMADYDGANPRRLTVNRSLNITPVWSADGKAIAYTSYRRNNAPDIFVSYIYEGRPPETPAHGTDRIHNFLPAWSPDGTRIAFMTNRDANPEIYVMNRDGSNLVRITRHPGIDATPTWSPSGNQIAFTSDRSGSPQIYIADADGLGQPRRITTSDSYADRAHVGAGPFNEIAYAARTGPGYDIKIYNVAEGGDPRLITHGEGSNESPAYSPTGRHLAFTSTRKGKQQIFVIGRNGKGLRQVTTEGNNATPNWSH